MDARILTNRFRGVKRRRSQAWHGHKRKTFTTKDTKHVLSNAEGSTKFKSS
jgi:hypothetical protein